MNHHLNKHLFGIAFLLGAAAVIWVGAGFIGSQYLALTMTAAIGVVYGLGALELRRFRHATARLTGALTSIPAPLLQLGDWLTSVPPPLQSPVRLRIEGERVGLPGPALTPYLVGFLVMLGMLGTFLGMVVTLNGAVFALEGTTDLQSIRTALAAPIKGLGLAFGTSVAGVAASAMLGLMSALSRRDRMQCAQLLDTQIATVLRGFSLTHQRQETFKALQLQSQALPQVADQLQALMAQMERMGQQLNKRLLSNQENFHANVKTVYTDLAVAVDQTLRDSLVQSAHLAGEGLKPVVQAAMEGVALESNRMHERMAGSVQRQLDELSERLAHTATATVEKWDTALARHELGSAALAQNLGETLEAFSATFTQRSEALVTAVDTAYTTHQAEQRLGDQQRLGQWTQTVQALIAQAQDSNRGTLEGVTRLMASSEELVRTRIATEADWSRQHGERMDQLTQLTRNELSALREQEARHGEAAVQRLGELQTALTQHLATLGIALEAPITRLIHTASEAPRAAAEVIGQLRQEMSNGVARDNALLEERGRILETLNTLLASIHHASAEQRMVIDTLVASSAAALAVAGADFSGKVEIEANKLSDIAAHVTSSAVEVSSLSEAFGLAVQSFGSANEKLIANLQRIEAAMDKSMLRSDDQLAYYVAQAREIIDLSISSQKELFDGLHKAQAQPVAVAEEVR
jgi:hypothetical protein